jgi:tetratricopeptide (TPR) repeat protein
MHVESVAWITERKDVVYAFFYLCALIFYLRFIQQGKAKNYWMGFLCFILSLCSKTTALTLPLILLLIDAYNRRTVTIHTVLEKLPFFVLSLAFGLIALHSQFFDRNFNFIDRIFLASYSLSYYLIHVFLPMNLSALHLMPIKTSGMLPVLYYLAPLPLILLAFIGTRKGIFQREYVFGLSFFVLCVSLTINFFPISMTVVAERFTYVAYIGLYYIIGQLCSFSFDWYQNILLPWKRVLIAGGMLLALFFGYLTYQRIGTWKSTLVLFQDASMKTNNIDEANFIHILAYENEGLEKIGFKLYTEALEWFNKAIALNPRYYKLYYDRGNANYHLHNYGEAIKDYDKTIELSPSFARAYFNRAVIYISWKRQEEACADLWTAYRLGMHDAFDAAHANCF